MKRLFLLGLTFTLLDLFCVSSFAQGPRKGQGMHHVPWNRECATLEVLELSASQSEAVKRIQTQYKDQIFESRQNLMVKRLELRDQLRSGDASETSIRTKSQELEEARRLLHGKMIDYQLHIRRILTPEQRRRWCTMMGEPVSRGGWKSDSCYR